MCKKATKSVNFSKKIIKYGMKTDKKHYNNKKIHLIGAGGVSMSAIAKHLIERGAHVRASDEKDCLELCQLKNLGAKTFVGHSKNNVEDADIAVYTQAIDAFNAELKCAREKGAKIYTRSQMLGEIMSDFDKTISIAGSHGKTTTTSLIARSLISAGKNPTVFLGGQDKAFGNYRKGSFDIAVVEACEYKKSFLDLKGNISVVLNVDNDHMDCYLDKNDMLNAFREFSKNSITVINADDEDAIKLFNCTTITFGINKSANYMAKNIKNNGANYSFTAYAYGLRLGRVNLAVLGEHNVYNALACIAVCDFLKLPFNCVKSAIERFDGVGRRNEYIGEYLGVKCYCDYAHHPSEISATLSVYKQKGQKFLTVFQPHTYSRTKLLMEQFVLVLKEQNPLLIMDTYPAREKFCMEGSALLLKDNLLKKGNKTVEFLFSDALLGQKIQQMLDKNIKTILFLGAGDIYEKAKNILVQKN